MTGCCPQGKQPVLTVRENADGGPCRCGEGRSPGKSGAFPGFSHPKRTKRMKERGMRAGSLVIPDKIVIIRQKKLMV